MKKKKGPQIKKILIPTDFSDGSDQAASYAVQLAEKFKAEIVLAHVIEPFNYSVSDTMIAVNHQSALKKIAIPLIENARRGLSRQGLAVKARLVTGVPYREILKIAQASGADLIVMGTHGRTGAERLLLGSVAEKVVRLSDCPVLTVHASEDRKAKPARRRRTAGVTIY